MNSGGSGGLPAPNLVHNDLVSLDTVVVVEEWEDLAAVKAHLISSHLPAFRFHAKDYVRGVHLLVLDPAE